MPLAEITPLHLSREWNRMLKSGGHTRRDKTPRPMSAKTVRNIAGVVSSAFGRAIKWGLITRNPVSDSEPPVPKRHYGIALTPTQQDLLIKSATSPWCLPTFLEMSAATGARRGEVLALRWSDIQDGRAIIARSLTQTKHVMEFKGTKSEKPRAVSIPAGTLVALEAHRKRQKGFSSWSSLRTDLDLIRWLRHCFRFGFAAVIALPSAEVTVPAHTLRHSQQPSLADGNLRRYPNAWGIIRPGDRIYPTPAGRRAARRWERFQGRNSKATVVQGCYQRSSTRMG
jgi:integrase